MSTQTLGLTSAYARERLRADGPNALPTAEQRGFLAIAFGVLRQPMFLLLCAAAGVYLVVGDARERSSSKAAPVPSWSAPARAPSSAASAG